MLLAADLPRAAPPKHAASLSTHSRLPHTPSPQTAARQKLADFIKRAEHTTLFDFPTKGILQARRGRGGGRAGSDSGSTGGGCKRCGTLSRQQCVPLHTFGTLRSTLTPTPFLICAQEAVKHTQYDRLRDGQGKAPGLIGWLPDKAVTFVDNHDTGSTQQVGGGGAAGQTGGAGAEGTSRGGGIPPFLPGQQTSVPASPRCTPAPPATPIPARCPLPLAPLCSTGPSPARMSCWGTHTSSPTPASPASSGSTTLTGSWGERLTSWWVPAR